MAELISELRRIFRPFSRSTIGRYVIVTGLIYGYVFSAMYVLIDVMGWNRTLSYVIVYGIAYTLNYLLTLKFVFLKANSAKTAIKYLIYILLSFLFGAALFHLLSMLHVNYALAMCIVMATLFPLRFLLNKLFVFR